MTSGELNQVVQKEFGQLVPHHQAQFDPLGEWNDSFCLYDAMVIYVYHQIGKQHKEG